MFVVIPLIHRQYIPSITPDSYFNSRRIIIQFLISLVSFFKALCSTYGEHSADCVFAHYYSTVKELRQDLL